MAAPLRYGILGAANIARQFTRGVAGSALARVEAVASRNAAKAAAFAAECGIPRHHGSYEALLADPAIEAIYIPLPNDMHCDWAIRCVQAGKHVLCEKPMAVSVAECKAMTKAAAKAGRELRIGFNNRAHPALQKLVKAIAAGRFGEALEARVQVYHPYPAPPPAWRQNRKRSGGWAIGDVGTHLLDVLRWMMQSEASAVSGHLTNRCWGFKTDDHAQVSVRFRNGAIGAITACTGAGGGAPRVEFYGTKGYFALRGGLFGMAGDLETGLKGQAAKFEKIDAFDTYGGEVEAFAAQARGRATSLASGEDGAANIAIVADARGW